MELVDIKECEVTIKLDLEGLRTLAWELGRSRREHEFEPLPDALAAFFRAACVAGFDTYAQDLDRLDHERLGPAERYLLGEEPATGEAPPAGKGA